MIPGRPLTGTAAELDALTLSARAMHGTVATLSRAGANVIADHVFLDAPGFDTWLEDCVRALRDLPALFVGVHSPLPILEGRELARGDRDVGKARWQAPRVRVHGHGAYDVEVDTRGSSVEACADAVRNGLDRSGGAFEALLRRFLEPG